MDPITVPTPLLDRTLNNASINICCWNIRRGLLIREPELKEIIAQNKINIIYLVETDTTSIVSEADFKIPGFKTIVQKKKDSPTITRIVCLVDEKLSNQIIVRMDLASHDFPSLWVEVENNNGANTICGGFYREWSPLGKSTIEAQVTAMEVFTEQIERATAENKTILILGDANLCSEKWKLPSYKFRRIAEELRETLAQCGLIQVELGPTYFADRLNDDGTEIKSSLDHIYMSESLLSKSVTKKLNNSATDHLPILTSLVASKTKKKEESGSFLKRSMKNFTKTRWLDCLRARNWDRIYQLTDVNEQTSEITK